MFKKRVVSLLCASAMALTAFSGVAFAAEPPAEGTPILRLDARDDSVQPYERVVYDVYLDPNGADVAGMQVNVRFNHNDVQFIKAVGANGFDFGAAVQSSDSNLLKMAVMPLDEGADATLTEETKVGSIVFKQPAGSEKEIENFHVSIEDGITCSADADKEDDRVLAAGSVENVDFEYKVELNLTSTDTAEMGLDYQVDVGISNIDDLVANGYLPSMLSFDIVYDSDAFVFSMPIDKDPADEHSLAFDAAQIEDGVVRVTAFADPMAPEAVLNSAIGSMKFVAKVVDENATASFKIENATVAAVYPDGSAEGLGVETTDLVVNDFSREKIDSFIKDAETLAASGVTVDKESGKVSVTDNQQYFYEGTVWDAEAMDTPDYNFTVKVVDAEGNDAVIGTTSHFVVERDVVVNYNTTAAPQETVTIDIYDLTMRIKGDVSFAAQNVYDPEYPEEAGQLINVQDLSNLKNWLLQGIPADTDEDIVWAATNIRTPEGNNTEVFIYDLFKVKDIILNG